MYLCVCPFKPIQLGNPFLCIYKDIKKGWTRWGLNSRLSRGICIDIFYKHDALTNWATSPKGALDYQVFGQLPNPGKSPSLFFRLSRLIIYISQSLGLFWLFRVLWSGFSGFSGFSRASGFSSIEITIWVIQIQWWRTCAFW